VSVLSLFGEQITADIQGVFMGKWRLKGKKKLRKYTDSDKEIRGCRQGISFMRGKQRFHIGETLVSSNETKSFKRKKLLFQAGETKVSNHLELEFQEARNFRKQPETGAEDRMSG